MTMEPGRQFVVFVTSSPREEKVWRALQPALAAHHEIGAAFALRHFDSRAALSRRGRWFGPSRRTQVEALRTFLDSPPFADEKAERDPDLVLAAFGGGCRIVQEYFVRLLRAEKDVRAIRRVQQAVLVSPPRHNWGGWLFAAGLACGAAAALLYAWAALSGIDDPAVELLIAALGTIFTLVLTFLGIATSSSHLAAIGLEPEWHFTAALDNEFAARVVHGSKNTPGTWPVAVQELSVPRLHEASASAIAAVCSAIAAAKGHPHCYAIERLERRTKITPVAPANLPADVRLHVITDNVTEYSVDVRFHARDRSEPGAKLPPWELRYGTKDGYLEIDYVPPEPNLWTPEERFVRNKRVIYRFHPRSSCSYSLRVKVYGGYNAGERNSHIHFRADASFDLFREQLDLRDYLKAGWEIARPPEAYLFAGGVPANLDRAGLAGPDCDCVTSRRVLESGTPLRVEEPEPGLYRWEVRRLTNGGLVGFVFDVAPKEAHAATA